MCGIAGFLNFNPHPSESQSALVHIAGRMADAIFPRGPDDRGTWVDPAVGVGIAFRRLAIVDVSPAGHQPMVSSSGRYIIAFNGEIYNHRELRHRLENESHATSDAFRGHSDTEVLVAAIEAWGFETALRQSVGMFAIALWDRHDRTLQFARDRIGEKPLYYGIVGRTLLFGSELKALRAHPDFDALVDRDALQLYMRHGCIPAPHSIYRGIYKLTPGSILTIRADGSSVFRLPSPQPFWSARDTAIAGQDNPLELSDRDAIAELERLLVESISGQMVADVPVGAFLSGGIDSSAVVAIMQSLSSRPVKTFSIGFHESGYDEATHARRVAQHLGTDHTDLYVTAEQSQAVIPKLPEIYDEPFADSSQIPTYLVSQLARQQVTVSLSGDGGDELFGGYTRYAISEKMWRYAGLLPRSVRKQIGSVICSQPAATLDRRLWFLAPLLRKYGASGPISGKLLRVGRVLKKENFQQLYRGVMSLWHTSDAVTLNDHEAYSLLNDPRAIRGISDIRRQMRFFDQVGYLPDDILAKVDRATMAVSLESRMPLLDHRIIDFSWRLPNRQLQRHGKSKWLLRQVLYRHVPRALIERPKMGFGVPLHSWLRGPLRDWAENLLSESKLRDDGYLNASLVRARWEQHVNGVRDWQHHLWAVLMFQSWREHTVNESLALQNAA